MQMEIEIGNSTVILESEDRAPFGADRSTN